MSYLRQKRGVDFVFDSSKGISLEDPRVIAAVRIFEERNRLLDKAIALDASIDQVIKNKLIPQAIKDFLNKKFVALYGEFESEVINIYPKGVGAVQYLAAMRQEVPQDKHGETYFLPQDAAEEIYNIEEKSRDIEDGQKAKTWMQRAVTIPQTMRAKYAVAQAHKRVFDSAIKNIDDDFASFLTAANARWSDEKYKKFDTQLFEIENFVSLIKILMPQLSTSQNTPIRPLVEQCVLALFDYTKSTTTESLDKAKRLIAQLSGVVETKESDVLQRVLEWKLRVDSDEVDTLAVVGARHAISPGNLSSETSDAMQNVRYTAQNARDWFSEIGQKIKSGEITPDQFFQIIKLLENQKHMKNDAHLAPFYEAIEKLEQSQMPHRSEAPKIAYEDAKQVIDVELSDIFEYPNILAEPKKFLEYSNQLYAEQGLPEWMQTFDIKHHIDSLSPEKRAIIERELQEGAIAMLMPGREVQRQTLEKAIQQLKPVWIENGQRKTVDETLYWEWIQQLLRAKNDLFFLDVPDNPYILLAKPTQAPPPNTVSKTVPDQIAEFERMKRERPELCVTNLLGYVALQSWATRMQNREGVQNIQPLDRRSFTRFIGLPVSGGIVPNGDFDLVYGQLRLGRCNAARPNSVGGFRVEVMIKFDFVL